MVITHIISYIDHLPRVFLLDGIFQLINNHLTSCSDRRHSKLTGKVTIHAMSKLNAAPTIAASFGQRIMAYSGASHYGLLG